ncbi:MAG TPA: asparagine synthetase B, partial [Blastocatellia bacterium]|nr:asparagine synthetase B [Blastocatellia bacterium]
MSAINGIFERYGSAPLEASIAASLAALTDYGTDGNHQWISGSIGLGHQLMTVFTEGQSDCLPLYDATTGLAITADVRLDSRRELYKALGISDCEEQNLSNSQLILCAWQKWGRNCPHHLIGDYAFAIWDARQQVLFC